MLPDSKDISSIFVLTVHTPACPEVGKSKPFTAVRVSRNHCLGYLSLVFSDLWDIAPEEGEASSITLGLSRTRGYHPHSQQARSPGAVITWSPVTALSLFPFHC